MSGLIILIFFIICFIKLCYECYFIIRFKNKIKEEISLQLRDKNEIPIGKVIIDSNKIKLLIERDHFFRYFFKE